MFRTIFAGAFALGLSSIGASAQQVAPQESANAHAHRHRGHHHHERHNHSARPSAPVSAPVSQGGAPHAGDHGVETENLFGFVSGSDVEHVGARGLAVETVLRTGKRSGDYVAAGKKLEFSYGLTDSLSVAAAVLGAYHRIDAVPGLDDVRTLRFNGLGLEGRWRLLSRDTNGFGLTLQTEPVWARSDELTGLAATKWGLENKLILDRELVANRLFGAFNVLHEMEHVKERGAAETERGSRIGLGFGLATPLAKTIFVGAEARYLHAYEGLGFNAFQGRALFVGPTLHARLPGDAWLSVAWSTQVAGRAKGDTRHLDLENFERHAVRVKVGMEF